MTFKTIVNGVENWSMQIVGDHYAVLKYGVLVGVVEKLRDGWIYSPINGDSFYGGSAAHCLRHAAQAVGDGVPPASRPRSNPVRDALNEINSRCADAGGARG